MGDFKSALASYHLQAALAADSDINCLIIDVGCNVDGQPVPSSKHVEDQVNYYLQHDHAPELAATKLYVIGKWNLTLSSTQETDSGSIDTKIRLDSTEKWVAATQKLKTLIEKMRDLTELTWIAGLPFTAAIWDSLPTSLSKLVLDLGEPVRLDQDGDLLHKSYITSNEMKPLQKQVKLKELRLFRVHESFQLTVWETVFRNTSAGGMRVLDLQMAFAPIVRSEQWTKAKDVAGLTVPTEQSPDKVYKGKDGKGILHYSVGTGEYLDDFCMRRARIASRLDEATPLSLWCLKLDGFVIDHLPFQHELSRIVALTCGEKCIDSGLRAPKTDRAPHNKWSRAVNNTNPHCFIQWPNWCGFFDDHGDQHNKEGVVVAQDMALSTPIDEFPPSSIVPLTEESLQMKSLDDALQSITGSDYFITSPVLAGSATANLPEAVSNMSERGSEVPTPTMTTPAAPCTSPVSSAASPTLSRESSVVVIDSTEESLSPTSTHGSFENVSHPVTQVNSFTMADDSITPTAGENKTPKKNTFAYKVRRSFDWLAGSSS